MSVADGLLQGRGREGAVAPTYRGGMSGASRPGSVEVGTLRSVMGRGEMRSGGVPRSKRGFLLAGVIAVPVLAAVVLILVVVPGGADPAPRPQAARTLTPTPKPPPETHPTRGEYVPPRPAPVTRAPEPTVRPTAKPSSAPRPRYRGDCPKRWTEIPAFKRWCERNGYRTR
jgi:hypothetical protein